MVRSEHGPVTHQGTIIDRIVKPRIWNVYTKRNKVGSSGEGVRS